MIFGLVTFAKVTLHRPSSIMRSAIYQAMTHLIFVSEVGNLGGGMWVRCRPTCIVGILKLKNNLATFYLTCYHSRDTTDTTQPILALNLDITHVGSTDDVLHLHKHWTIKEFPPYNTTLGGRESLIIEPRSTTPSATTIWIISNTLVLIRNCSHAQTSNA